MNTINTNFNNKIPKLYEQQDTKKKIIYGRYFVHGSDWIWNILEYSKLQKLFFAYVEPEEEYQYVSINELENISYDYGVNINLDFAFEPIPLEVNNYEN